MLKDFAETAKCCGPVSEIGHYKSMSMAARGVTGGRKELVAGGESPRAMTATVWSA